jgi:putative spermidine/putrescine transport system ATP-binding protein
LALPSPTAPPSRAPALASPGAAAPAIRLEGLTKVFATGGEAGRRVAQSGVAAVPGVGLVAVDHVDLDVRDGEFFSMLGPSGSGKTTTLRMIAGFELPTEGRVLLHGIDVTRQPPFLRDVNTVFQDYALFPHMSVGDNVAYGLLVRKVPKPERARRVGDALDMVRLSGFEKRKPGQLSGGQRQRVALARALVNRPRVLLLDEPLGALDLKLREEMQIELKAIQQQVGITFIYVTHDQEEALTMSDRLAVFNRGRIEQVGPPADVYERPATAFVAGFVGTSNLLKGEVARALLGEDGTFSIRPEKIVLRSAAAQADSPEPETVEVPGVVQDIVYLGSATHSIVDLDIAGDDGTRLSVMHQNLQSSLDTDMAQRGERVLLRWQRAHVVSLGTERRNGDQPREETS